MKNHKIHENRLKIMKKMKIVKNRSETCPSTCPRPALDPSSTRPRPALDPKPRKSTFFENFNENQEHCETILKIMKNKS